MSIEQRRESRESLLLWLRDQLPVEQADRLYYHLGDLREAFAKVVKIIDDLPSSGNSKSGEAFRKPLADLAGELQHHIPAHLAEVAPDLDAWRNQVYEEAERRGEL
jgi:hypothetical protein